MGSLLRYLMIGLLVAGCAKSTRDGIISQSLPLTVDDLSEIRMGEKNHEDVVAQYEPYENKILNEHLDQIALDIANVSTRPHLPYKVYVLDTQEVNVFGGPGGYIYMTRGFLGFVDAESEIAGAIAHEIAHIANHEYDNIPQHDKIQKVYDLLLTGSEMAKGAIGSYGTAANYGLKGLGKAAPKIAHRFSYDQEIVVDGAVLDYLVKAGYDPIGYVHLIDKLTKIPMQDVNRFVVFLNSHPPFQDRQKFLAQKVKIMLVKEKNTKFKKDDLEAITLLMEPVVEVAVLKPAAPVRKDSILFQPALGMRIAPSQSEQSDPSMRSAYSG